LNQVLAAASLFTGDHAKNMAEFWGALSFAFFSVFVLSSVFLHRFKKSA